jgi:tetratricopeptide (TPR) repeat protein
MKNKIIKISLIVVAILALAVAIFMVNKSKNNEPDQSVLDGLTTETVTEKKPEYKAYAESVYIENSQKQVVAQDYSAAKRVIEEGLGYYPKSQDLMMSYVNVLSTLGEKDKALEYANKLIKTNSSNYAYWKLKAQLYKGNNSTYTQEQKDYLTKLYNDALVATNNNIEIISTYAVFAEDYLTKQKAIELWTLAKSVNPIGANSYQVIIDRLSK